MTYNVRQYRVPEPFFGPADGNVVNDMDQKRIRSYDLYEDLYNNDHNSLKIVLRGDDSLPIYMPNGKKIVNTTNRFLARGFDYFVEPNDRDGKPVDEGTLQTVEQYMANLYKREAIKAKFASSKRWGLVRADAIFMITADPNKVEGSRISIHEVDPRSVFLIDDPDEVNRIWGVHIVERVKDFREDDQVGTTKQLAKRSTYYKEKDPNDPNKFTGKVTHEVTHWEIGKWDDRTLSVDKLERVVSADHDQEMAYLETSTGSIPELPLYIWSIDKPMNSSWGTSLLSGLETLIFGINQSLSDEDLTLVMRGLGMYVTNAGAPVGDNGEILSWNVGPGQIIEIGESQEFTNVAGVGSVEPYQDHMKYMDEIGLQESSGTPGVAVGRVDVTVAESGISLKLQLDPLLAANQERELEMLVTLDQMHYDLVTYWLPTYEGIKTNGCVVSTIFDDPMPINTNQVIQDVVLLRTSNLILTEMAVDKLSEIGWKYPAGMSVQDVVDALNEQAKSDATNIDPFAASGRFGEEQNSFENEVDPETIPDRATVPLGVT